MTREDFLSLMITQLELMKNEEEKQLQSLSSSSFSLSPSASLSLTLSSSSSTLQEIFQKFQYDFPLLSDEQILTLSNFLFLFGTVDYEDDEMNFQLTERFLENISYLRSASSYSNHQNCNLLYEGIYLFLPLALLGYHQERLRYILNIPIEEEISIELLFFRVLSLMDISLPSMFASNRTIPLKDSTQTLIINTLANIIHLLGSPLTPTNPLSSDTPTLNEYCSALLHSIVNQTNSTEISEENIKILNRLITLFSSLLFLVRDLCILKEEFALKILPTLFQRIIFPLIQIPAAQLQSTGHYLGTGIIIHLQTSIIFLLSDLCASYSASKPSVRGQFPPGIILKP